MEISGIISKILPERTGISKKTGQSWKAGYYVIETNEVPSKTVMFEVFGDEKISSMNIQLGERLTVYFDIEAREYLGRWYNQVKAWKIERLISSEFNTTIVPPVSQDEVNISGPWTDLPFDSSEVLPF